MSDRDGFDPRHTYVHLSPDGDGQMFVRSPTFWRELAGMSHPSDAAHRVIAGGWLVAAFEVKGPDGRWEQHPHGEEVLHCVSGVIDVELDGSAGPHRVHLVPGLTTVVPRGVWHRFHGVEPGQILAITFGRDTQHR